MSWQFRTPDDHNHFLEMRGGFVNITSSMRAHPVGIDWHVWLWDWKNPTPFANEVKAVIFGQTIVKPLKKTS